MSNDLVLTDIPWDPEGSMTAEDAVYSLLVEAPSALYLSPDHQHLWTLARGTGLIHARGDFSKLTNEELFEIVKDIKEEYDG